MDAPKIRELNADEVLAVESGLAFAARIAAVERPLSLDQLQTLYDGFLNEAVDDANAVIALGLSFGQCVLSSGPFEWVRFQDDHGEETSLAVIGASICVHPISMIQKRLQRGEAISIEVLCNDTLATLGEQVSKGKWEAR